MKLTQRQESLVTRYLRDVAIQLDQEMPEYEREQGLAAVSLRHLVAVTCSVARPRRVPSSQYPDALTAPPAIGGAYTRISVIRPVSLGSAKSTPFSVFRNACAVVPLIRTSGSSSVP